MSDQGDETKKYSGAISSSPSLFAPCSREFYIGRLSLALIERDDVSVVFARDEQQAISSSPEDDAVLFLDDRITLPRIAAAIRPHSVCNSNSSSR